LPKFSVIIPLYNGAKYIRTALDSVSSQTFRDFEIVICDDGSTDDSADIIKKYSQSHPELKIKYVYQKNKGLGGARNTAIRSAEGDVLALLDQDDIWYPEKLAMTAKVFDSDSDLMIVCNDEDIIKNGKKYSVSKYGPYSKDMFRQLLYKGNCLSTSATSIKRAAFDSIGGFSEDIRNIHFVEDYDYWLRLALNSFKFSFLKKPLGCYVLHEGNYSSNNLGMMCDHEGRVLDINYSRLKKKGLADLIAIRKRMFRLYLSNSKMMYPSDLRGSLRYFIKALMSVLF